MKSNKKQGIIHSGSCAGKMGMHKKISPGTAPSFSKVITNKADLLEE